MTEAGALRRLETLCARSEHSEGELLDKMRRWGLSDEEQTRIMEKLVKTHFVDDERFTEAFIHDKIVFNGWGRRKIEQGHGRNTWTRRSIHPCSTRWTNRSTWRLCAHWYGKSIAA